MTSMGPRNTVKRKDSGGIDWSSLVSFGPGYIWFVVFVLGVAAGAVGFVGYDFYRFSRSAGVLTVELEIEGLEVIRYQRVLNLLEKKVLNDERGRRKSLLAVPPREVKNILLDNFKRFESVFVRREFPEHLYIEVSERQPEAIVIQYDSELERRRGKLIDREGILFPPAPDERKELIRNLPRVMGLGEAEDDRQFKEAWERCYRVLEISREVFSRGILDWIRIRPSVYFIKAQINRPRELEIRLGVDKFEKKLTRLKELMATEVYSEIGDYIDLTDPDDIYTGEKQSKKYMPGTTGGSPPGKVKGTVNWYARG